jgi:hypothetical protein
MTLKFCGFLALYLYLLLWGRGLGKSIRTYQASTVEPHGDGTLPLMRLHILGDVDVNGYGVFIDCLVCGCEGVEFRERRQSLSVVVLHCRYIY